LFVVLNEMSVHGRPLKCATEQMSDDNTWFEKKETTGMTNAM